MERLTGMDAIPVNAEAGPMNIHITALLLVDPRPAGPGFDADHLYALLAERLPRNPLVRLRLVHKPLRLGQPVFVDDPDFDVHKHLQRLAVPAPGGPRQVAALIDEIHRHRLGHDKPLWEAWVIEGLADGRLALAVKFSHALSDGVGAVNRLLPTLLSTDPDHDPDYPEPGPAAPLPGTGDLLADWLAESAGNVAGAARVVGRGTPQLGRAVAERLLSMAAAPLRRLRGGEIDTDPRLRAAPADTPLNRPISERRNSAYAEVELDRMRDLGAAYGVTVNDVFIAACTTALRQWLLAHDTVPDGPLQVFVPISTRSADDDAFNSWSLALVRLPVFLPDPVERLTVIHQATNRVKSGRGANGPTVDVVDLVQLVPPTLLRMAASTYVLDLVAPLRPPFFHACFSNIPGPRGPLWLGGARLEGIYPFGPLFQDMNVNLTAVSYDGHFGLGVVGCPDNVPDVWEISDAWLAALGELDRNRPQCAPLTTPRERDEADEYEGSAD
ncbi:wax ester/triacylglycerol synthase family O-acyltransferase [Gordonia defluvii]|uniref:Diacylglycerol O-acyltransferase n=1 Tax=Gordonia defluvii TaxID=283718 RepID=A0ABP6LHQ5_9ACTN|nr:wax ester/triacylglycerol synthase family O-acyltransferase [Gordonia sp. UBA5067]